MSRQQLLPMLLLTRIPHPTPPVIASEAERRSVAITKLRRVDLIFSGSLKKLTP